MSPDALAELLIYQSNETDRNGGALLGELVIERGLCTEEQVLECLATELRLPYVRLDQRLYDRKLFHRLPFDFLEKHVVLPLFQIGNTLTVAVAEPTNVFLLDRLKAMAQCDVQLVLAGSKDILRALQAQLSESTVFAIEGHSPSSAAAVSISSSLDSLISGIDESKPEDVSRLLNRLLGAAIRAGASDVHIEPMERHDRVRFRVDGSLFRCCELPSRMARSLKARLKEMAELNVDDWESPQDGRIRATLDNHTVDLGVSLFPLARGSKAVIHLLDTRAVTLTLERLGFSSGNLDRFESQIRRRSGLVLVAGPNGGGKCTTMYAALKAISSEEKNICTVEDPIHSELPFANQCEVDVKRGFDSATLLANLLKQDPDVLLIGEIREEQTARLAIQASLAGHLVLAALPTYDACNAVTQLINMGIESHLLAVSLNGVLAQRLCRCICPKCREVYDPPRAMRAVMQQAGLEPDEYVHGAGCDVCRRTGFSGRIALHEMLVMDDTLRETIANSPTVRAIREKAIAAGMVPLRYDGLTKVREGLTTIEEVLQASDDGGTIVRRN